MLSDNSATVPSLLTVDSLEVVFFDSIKASLIGIGIVVESVDKVTVVDSLEDIAAEIEFIVVVSLSPELVVSTDDDRRAG